ncbi:hypothetical protein BDW22DRAFT_1348772, partial [Trametopsis cervina]
MNSRSRTKGGKRAASTSPPDTGVEAKRTRTGNSTVREIDSTVTWVPDKIFVAGTSPGSEEEKEPIDDDIPRDNLLALPESSVASITGNLPVNGSASGLPPTLNASTEEVPADNASEVARAVFGTLPTANEGHMPIVVNGLPAPFKKAVDIEDFQFSYNVGQKNAHVFVAAAVSINAASHVYPISAIPRTISWGSKNATLAKFLCIDDKIITVKIVGSITSLYFYDRLGAPSERVNVGIRPLRERDSLAAQNYLQKFTSGSRPRTDGDDFVLYASKYCTKTVRGEVRPQAYRFDNIWDGSHCTESLRTRTKMDGPERLVVNDIVLLE